jgi:hypothetical protein
MNQSTKQPPPTVPPEEVERRLAEYRRLGFQRQAPAHVVYHDEHLGCPWASCDLRIAGINFRLELQGDPPAQAQWLAAWWNGAGLVGRCPRCGRHVLFGLEGKRAVSDPAAWGTAVLPDDWHQKAHIVERTV